MARTVLFSNDRIARVINSSFEPVWVSVRPVPIVRIDFGNGNVLTRTLHGNIATYACTSDGTVLDVVPGIYEPQTYLSRLGQFVMLHMWLKQAGEEPSEKLQDYHQKQLAALAKGESPYVVAYPRRQENQRNGSKRRAVDVSKSLVIEGPLELTLQPGPAISPQSEPEERLGIASPSGRTLWRALAEDTRINETDRRKMIHECLAKRSVAGPDQVTKWLYREVLHSDLDDPYLGLSDLLFASYPFKDEDERQ